MKFQLLSKDESVIFSNIFCIRGERVAYFNTRGVGNVI
jgi:hypothetical protein